MDSVAGHLVGAFVGERVVDGRQVCALPQFETGAQLVSFIAGHRALGDVDEGQLGGKNTATVSCARLELTSLVPRSSPVASLNQRPPPSPLLAKLPVIFEPVIVSEGLTGDGPAPSMFMQPP
jgi:hypothetical protein